MRVDVLPGLAFGDAYALGWEFSWPPPRPRWSDDPSLLRPVMRGGNACYSDDTEMALILARHLLLHGGVDQDGLARELAAGARLGDECRFYGSTTSFVLYRVREGVPWREASGETMSYGNGAAIRAPPVAVYFREAEAVVEAARLQAEVTHSHPLGVQGAQIVALAVYHALEGVPPEELPSRIVDDLALDKVYRDRLRAVEGLLGSTPLEAALKLGTGAAAPESVPSALLSAARAEGSVVKAVLSAICLGGDTDSIASMAASIVAAYSGVDAPRELLAAIEGYSEIEDISRRLAGEA